MNGTKSEKKMTELKRGGWEPNPGPAGGSDFSQNSGYDLADRSVDEVTPAIHPMHLNSIFM
jgi:hypothetical protein